MYSALYASDDEEKVPPPNGWITVSDLKQQWDEEKQKEQGHLAEQPRPPTPPPACAFPEYDIRAQVRRKRERQANHAAMMEEHRLKAEEKERRLEALRQWRESILEDMRWLREMLQAHLEYYDHGPECLCDCCSNACTSSSCQRGCYGTASDFYNWEED